MLPGRAAKDDARANLTRRLVSVFTGVVLAATIAFGARDLLQGNTPLLGARALVAVALASAFAVLMLRARTSFAELRSLEVLVFGTLSAYLATQAYTLGAAELAAAPMATPAIVVPSWTGAVLRFALLMVAYGVFVPNTPVRAAGGLAMIAATAMIAPALVHMQHPELRDAFAAAAAHHLLETVLLLGAAAAVAVFAAFLTGNLFDFAYEQRRRMFYDLEERIGAGGMGEVWRARHRTLSKPTALKLIREDKVGAGAGEEAHRVLQRFEREAKATAALRSPHTIGVYDFGVTEDGHFFYAMEYLEGVDLETLVERFGPVPAERAVHLLLQACDSLADAHEHGLTHRDVKPANLFLSRLGPSNDHVKILDFGLVQTAPEEDEAERLTAEGTTSGTPAFMAPEMALRHDGVDGRADIYALGGVAYWLLTGKYVFEADGGVAMIVEHVKTQPTPPSHRTELPIPPALDDIVMRCLRKDPTERFASARELAAALSDVAVEPRWTPARAAEWWDLHQPRRPAA